jgi:hypothetical protein
MRHNRSKTEEVKKNTLFPQSFSNEEEVCKDDEYYDGIVDFYFYFKRSEKEVEI